MRPNLGIVNDCSLVALASHASLIVGRQSASIRHRNSILPSIFVESLERRILHSTTFYPGEKVAGGMFNYVEGAALTSATSSGFFPPIAQESYNNSNALNPAQLTLTANTGVTSAIGSAEESYKTTDSSLYLHGAVSGTTYMPQEQSYEPGYSESGPTAQIYTFAENLFIFDLAQAGTIRLSGTIKSIGPVMPGAKFLLYQSPVNGNGYGTCIVAQQVGSSPMDAIANLAQEIQAPAGRYTLSVYANMYIATSQFLPSYQPGTKSGAASYDVTLTVDSPNDKSDLKASQASSSVSVQAASPFVVSSTVTNSGDGDANPSVLGYYLSDDQTLDPTDPLIGSALVPFIAEHSSSQLLSGTATIPAGTKSGTYYVIAKADIQGTVDESNEDNNTATPVKIEVGSFDLKASVDADHVVPTAAADLNLNHVFGGEQVTMPVTLGNLGPCDAAESATIQLSLSETKQFDQSRVLTPPQSISVNIHANGTQVVPVTVTVPTSGLTAGKQYYLVAKVVSSQKETDALGGPADANNVAATDRTFEFVGTPKGNPTVFSGGLYYAFLRDLANQSWAINHQGRDFDQGSAQDFIVAFETSGKNYPYPYKDGKGIPTIGIGINLMAMSAKVQSDLVIAVRRFFAAQAKLKTPIGKKYAAIKLGTDGQIVAMLQKWAKGQPPSGVSADGKTKITLAVTDPAIDAAGVEQTFQDAYAEHAATARKDLGAVAWSNVAQSPRAAIAVVDFIYNVGSFLGEKDKKGNYIKTPWTGFRSALQITTGPDYVLAAFQLADAYRTTDPKNTGLRWRTEAEIQNLLFGLAKEVVHKV